MRYKRLKPFVGVNEGRDTWKLDYDYIEDIGQGKHIDYPIDLGFDYQNESDYETTTDWIVDYIQERGFIVTEYNDDNLTVSFRMKRKGEKPSP